MEFIKLTHENLEREHICCAISNSKDVQVVSKKAWLSARLDEGLVFLKGDVRGKCFIEYITAEYAWAPIDAEGCFCDRTYTKAYLHHLFKAQELLAMQIASIHNLSFYLRLVTDAREHIENGDFTAWKRSVVDNMTRRL